MRDHLCILLLMATISSFGCHKTQQATPPSQDLVFNFNVLHGSLSSAQDAALNNGAVQRLLLDIARQARTGEYLEYALRNTGTTRHDLESAGLARRDGDTFVINFLLFTKTDEQKLKEITEEHAEILARALLGRRGEIEAVLARYDAPGADRFAALYFMLGCFSLDWDGLALTAERGYRKTDSWFEKLFPRTVIYGWEPGEPSKKAIYCGSHNSEYGNAMLTSFGDHEIQPRRTAPDILWGLSGYPDTLKAMISEAREDLSSDDLGEEIGDWMLALRSGSKSVRDLAAAASIDAGRASILAKLLASLGYVTYRGDSCSTRVPVLTLGDSSMVYRIREIGREEMERWFEADYPRLHEELTQLTPFRYGQDQRDFFYQVWHDIFGAVNRKLVEAGLFADPYSGFYGARGVIPLVYETLLIDI